MNVSGRERDLVLAPNEFAFISDQTKGHIVAYVGPFKTSMANTDKPVFFDQSIKRFNICSLEESIQTFTTAPEGWYVELKNPPKDGKQPQAGTSNNLTVLDIGRKVNIPGPVFFALWPGQMVRVVQGHHLRSNQYLLVRVYDEAQAQQNWNQAVIKLQNTTEEDKPDILEQKAPQLTMGQILVVKGTQVSFYIPPTGLEVLRDEKGNSVRDAVTLERLEYCILLDENGNKRYIRGAAVVFPEPTESFVTKNGENKFKAIELNENSGIYVKVIAPYTENGKNYEVGEELFITGKEQMIYFPRPEHALVKYGKHETYHAIAIPPGEGRYYLNRNTGKISLKKGACIFLPDPREEVIVNRVLSEKQCQLWFPNNTEALNYNRQLRELAKKDRTGDFVPQNPPQESPKEAAQESNKKKAAFGDEFERGTKFQQPRSITLDEKFAGAVTLDVWTGYAVLVVSKTGERKVIVGPQSYLLEYDESLQAIELSTGTPKNDNNLFRTVYLRCLHNKVSDRVLAQSKDFCDLEITLSYRVNFTGEPEKWFDVENYVKFMTDHLRSLIRNALKKHPVVDFYANGIDTLRNIILGKADENGKRTGRLFPENGMLIYDVEILDIELLDDSLAEIIAESQHEQVRHKISLENQQRKLEFSKQHESIAREIALAESQTRQELLDLQMKELKKQFQMAATQLDNQLKSQESQLNGDLAAQNIKAQIHLVELNDQKLAEEQKIRFAQQYLEQRLQELRAEVEAVSSKAQAVSPDLIAALQMFSDRSLAEKMAETMAPLSIIGGKSIAEVFAKLLQGTSLENVLKQKI